MLSVKQDFYATIDLTGLESILTQYASEQLAEKSADNKLTQTVNKRVSFNAVKNHLIELFYHYDTPIRALLETLANWFKTTPTYTNRSR